MIQAPDGIEYKDLREIHDVATNIDPVDQPTHYAMRLRGGRIGESEQGYVFKRDFGSQARFAAANPYPSGNARYDTPKDTFFDPVNGTSHDIIVDLDDLDPTKPKNTRVYVDTSVDATGTWKEMTARYTAKINGTPGAADTKITFDTVQDIKGSVVASPDASLFVNCVIVNTTGGNANETVFGVSKNDTLIINVDHVVGSTGLTWSDNDDLVIYFDNSLQFIYVNGDTPHIRFKPVEAQRKMTMFYGDSSAVPVARYPFQMYRRAARKYFYTDATNALMTLADGWYAGQGGSALCNFFAIGTGTSEAPQTAASGSPAIVEVYDFDSTKPWLKISQTWSSGSARTGYEVNLYFKITLLYADYQESDPIYASYLYGYETGISSVLAFDIDFSMMNKEVTGILIYAAPFEFVNTLTPAQKTIIRRLKGPNDYILYKTIDFTKFDATDPVWSGNQLTKYNVVNAGFSFDTDTTTAEDSSSTLLGSLNHAPIEKTRVIPKPLFAVRAARQQGAVDVIALDSSTLLFSNFSGSGNFEDDNYPDVRISVDDHLQKVFLTGHGEMMGLFDRLQ